MTAADDLLKQQREALDACDTQLLSILRERMVIIHDVSEIKRAHGLAVMQSDRVAQIDAKVRCYALAHGLSPDFLSEIYHTIITEACRIEKEHIFGAVPDERSRR